MTTWKLFFNLHQLPAPVCPTESFSLPAWEDRALVVDYVVKTVWWNDASSVVNEAAQTWQQPADRRQPFVLRAGCDYWAFRCIEEADCTSQQLTKCTRMTSEDYSFGWYFGVLPSPPLKQLLFLTDRLETLLLCQTEEAHHYDLGYSTFLKNPLNLQVKSTGDYYGDSSTNLLIILSYPLLQHEVARFSCW